MLQWRGNSCFTARQRVPDLSVIIPLSCYCSFVSLLYPVNPYFLCYDNYYESLSDTPGSQLIVVYVPNKSCAE